MLYLLTRVSCDCGLCARPPNAVTDCSPSTIREDPSAEPRTYRQRGNRLQLSSPSVSKTE